MKLTTVPSPIRPPRIEDWIIDDEIVGTIAQRESGTYAATIRLDCAYLDLACWVIGTGPTKEEAVSNTLRKLSMVSLHVSQSYTKIVAGIA